MLTVWSPTLRKPRRVGQPAVLFAPTKTTMLLTTPLLLSRASRPPAYCSSVFLPSFLADNHRLMAKTINIPMNSPSVETKMRTAGVTRIRS